MSHIPTELKYTDNHEWVSVDNNIATVGLTDHAQSLLGNIVFVELPELDSEIHIGEEIGVVESVKAASDFYAPVSGTIIAINNELSHNTEMINESPYDDGWLYKIQLDDEGELDELMESDDYQSFVDEQAT